MKNSIIAAIIIIAVSGNVAQAATAQQEATYKMHVTNMQDVTIRNAFRRMEMVKVNRAIDAKTRSSIENADVSSWEAFNTVGVMDANDMQIIQDIIHPRDANGNSVW